MNIFYIYIHLDPRTNEVRYVGKGRGKRAYELSNRYGHHKNWINKLKSLDLKPIIQILERDLLEKDALDKEKMLIAAYKQKGFNLTNLTDGGEGISGYKHTEETRKKLSERPSWHKGKRRSQEFKDKVSATKKGRPQTEKARAISIANSSFKKGFIPWNKGLLGWNSGSDNVRSKPVIDINTGFTWVSITETSDVYGIPIQTLHNWLSGRIKNKTNLRYIEDVL